MKKLRIISLLLIAVTSAIAQAPSAYRYKATLPVVTQTGYYRINLSPQFTAKCRADLADIRLSARNKFVPYLQALQLPHTPYTGFIGFFKQDILNQPDTVNAFVFQRTTDKLVDNLWLRIGNTTVSRTFGIAGSDDMQRWFAISENIPMQTGNGSAGNFVQQVSFPASSYHYFKITVNSKAKNAVKILEGGTCQPIKDNMRRVAITPIKVSHTDSAHISRYLISFEEPVTINQLHFTVSAPELFRRQVTVYDVVKAPEMLTQTYLSNGQPEIDLAVKTGRLEVNIDNHDDTPVQNVIISALQDEQYVVARLEANTTYTLYCGNQDDTAPEYDLKYFTGNLGSGWTELTNQSVIQNAEYQNHAHKSTTKSYPILLWAAVSVAVMVLLVLTLRMAREVGKRQNG